MHDFGGLWRNRVVRALRSEIIWESVANGRSRDLSGWSKPKCPTTDIGKLSGFKKCRSSPSRGMKSAEPPGPA